MATTSASLEIDNYGHLALISLFVSAMLYILISAKLAICISILAGIFLIILYSIRIRNIPIHVRTPLSDTLIAMGGMASSIYLFNQITNTPNLAIFDVFTPWLALGFLLIGSVSKLLLFEEGIKELLNYSTGRIQSLYKWVMNSKKNIFRTIFLTTAVLLIVFRAFVDNIFEDEIALTLSSTILSFMILLDIRNVSELRMSRRVISFPLSIILTFGWISFPEDDLLIGSRFIAFSLFMTSVNFRAVFHYLLLSFYLIKDAIIFFSIIIKYQISNLLIFVRSNLLTIIKIISFIVGLILVSTPSNSTIDLLFLSPKFNSFLGSILMIVPLLSKINRFRQIFVRIWYPLIVVYLVNSYNRMKSIFNNIFRWTIIHRIILSRALLSIITILEIIFGPKENYLNYIIGLILFIIVFWPIIKRILDITIKFFVHVYNYHIVNFSNSSGYLGLILFILSVINREDIIGIFLLFTSSILLSYAWNNAIFRILDNITGFVVFLLITIQRIFYIIVTYFFKDSPISKIINVLGWIFFLIAIFGISPIDRSFALFLWVVIWNSAYPKRRNRVARYTRSFVNSIFNFIKSSIIGLRNFIVRAGRSLISFIKISLFNIYIHSVLIVAWVIAIFFAILSFGLIFTTDLSRSVFGDVVDDSLSSVIIAFTLLSASTLTIQQTYLRRDILRIGGDKK